MIRRFGLGDLFTLANGACGLVAIFEAMKFLADREVAHPYGAALVIPVAPGNLYPVTVLGVDFHLPALLFFVSGCLMISKTLRIPKP